MKDKVSVIIPTYNRATMLRDTLNSVIAQTHGDWECIVIDDGSNDGTEALMREYTEREKRFSFIKRPKNIKKGASSCRNLGLLMAKGDYIQFLDSDDLISPTKMSDQLAVVTGKEGIIACCSWGLFSEEIEKDFVEIRLSFKEELYTGCKFLKNLGKGNNFFPPHCYLVPRKTVELAGTWNETLSNNDDGEYFTRLITASSGVHFKKQVDAFYRRSGTDNLSGYSNRSRVISAIRSWQLVEDHLRKCCSNESLTYVVNARQQLFQTIKNRFPRTVAEHKEFFKAQFEEEPHRLNRFYIFKKSLENTLRKLKRKLF